MTNSTWLWRLIVGGMITGAFGLSAWTTSSVANMPKEYTSKQELQQLRQENRQDHRDILNKIDKIVDKL
jgi:hypothetical protein